MFTFPEVDQNVWRFIGFVSSLFGFICYATSPPFNKLYECGELGLLVIIIYCVLGSLVCCTMLCAKSWGLKKNSVLKAHVVFFVLMGTSVYSFYQDKSEEGKDKKEAGKVLNLISCGAFAVMSLSLSRITDLGFEAGMFNFFLGCVMTSVMKMNVKFALAAAAFCYILISIRTYSDSQHEGTQSSNVEQALIENVPSESNAYPVRNLGGCQDLNNQGTSSSFNNNGGALDFTGAKINSGQYLGGQYLGGRQDLNNQGTSSSFNNNGGALNFIGAKINSGHIDIRKRPMGRAAQSEGTQSHSEEA